MVSLPDYLTRYDPDPLRYLLSINMPETTDTDFSWREFYRRNNDELVATYGNLAHRVLTFTYKNYDGAIPTPGEMDSQSEAIIARAAETLSTVGDLLSSADSRTLLSMLWDWRRKPTAIWMRKPHGR